MDYQFGCEAVEAHVRRAGERLPDYAVGPTPEEEELAEELARFARELLGAGNSPKATFSSYFLGGDHSGGWFDRLDLLGSDGPPNPDVFEIADLLAINLMSEKLGGPIILDILTPGTFRDQLSKMLADVGEDVDIWDPAAPDRLREAHRLWCFLKEHASSCRKGRLNGLGPTRLSKLLARKRPMLVPVTDGTVRKKIARLADPGAEDLKGSVNTWRVFRATLGDPAVRRRLVRARDDFLAAHPSQELRRVSALRILDALLWMPPAGDGGPTVAPVPDNAIGV